MSNVTYPFRPEGTVSLSVSTTSANVTLSGGGRVEAVRVANTGAAYIAAITSASTTTLAITSGVGV